MKTLKLLAMILVLAFAGTAFAQNECTPNNVAFDSAYWLSQPPQVQALQNVTPYTTRVTQATALAQQGFTVDVPIMVWNWDACLTMFYRQSYGYAWVPSALQPNISVAPGVTQPGATAYNPNSPPPGSIRVDTNAADYVPFIPPPPPPNTQQPTVLVGPLSFGTMYLTVPYDNSPAGTKYTDSRGTFVKFVQATPFGNEAYWILQTPATTPALRTAPSKQ